MAQALAVRMANAAQVTVFRNNNGTLTALGNAFTPTGGMLVDSTHLDKKNLAVQFGSEFYCVVSRDIRKFNPSTGNWDAEVIPGGTLNGGANHEHTGLYVGAGPSSAPRLYCLFVNAANFYQSVFLDPGGAWTLGVQGPAQGSEGSKSFGGSKMVFRNQLHAATGRDIVIYDPATDSTTQQNIGGGGAVGGGASFCRARGGAWMARTASLGSASDFVNLYQFIGGSYQLAINGSSSTPTLTKNNGSGQPDASAFHTCMHYDPASDRIILHSFEDIAAAQGWRAFSLDPGGGTEVVEITTTVAPGPLQHPGGPNLTTNDVHWSVQVDNESNPGTQVVVVWLLIENGTWEAFQWNGIASVMTSLGTGADRGIALSNFQTGGGEYIYEGSTTANPSLHVEEAQVRVPIPGGTRIFVRGSTFDETGGAPASAVEDIGLYFGTSVDQSPDQLATLSAVAKVSGPGAIPTLSANKMIGVTLDNTTIYSMDWTAVTSAEVANGVFHQAMPRIEI